MCKAGHDRRMLYKRKLAQGLCGACGIRPIAQGSKSACTVCLDKARACMAVNLAKRLARLDNDPRYQKRHTPEGEMP